MDKLNFVTRLPPGFRFQPTDEELVFQYLRRKIFAYPLPSSIIPEINVYKYDPWELPGDLHQEKYFFSNKEAKYKNGKRSNRATNSGYWKTTGVDKRIGASSINEIMGMKKILVFYKGKSPQGFRTDWIMHEYRLITNSQSNNSNLNNCVMDNWVLCRIFLKKRNTKFDEETIHASKDYRINQQSQPKFIDFEMAKSSSSSCSSSSSVITEISSYESDSEETTACNIF